VKEWGTFPEKPNLAQPWGVYVLLNPLARRSTALVDWGMRPRRGKASIPFRFLTLSSHSTSPGCTFLLLSIYLGLFDVWTVNLSSA
jgi:hypothetical protein